MEIYFENISKENWKECIELKVSLKQEKFVNSNVYSIAQSKVDKNLIPLCIYHEDKMIGFAMYSIDSNLNNSMWIWRFMIDERFQCNGYGKVALIKLMLLIQEKHNCKIIHLGTENPIAKKLYESIGFKKTGKKFQDEELLFIKLD